MSMKDSLQWRRSSRCSSSTCVEVAQVGDMILLRDSKNPAVAPLRFTTSSEASSSVVNRRPQS